MITMQIPATELAPGDVLVTNAAFRKIVEVLTDLYSVHFIYTVPEVGSQRGHCQKVDTLTVVREG